MVPKTGLLAGRTLNGGLIFAGVDGAPTQQGDPAAVKVAPRAGFSFAINRATVLRGGYGLFFAPWNYSPTQHGQTGFSRTTSLNQSDSTRGVPITSLENPYPNGLQQPIGSSLGLLTGTGGTVNFVDQNKGDPKVHQYSVDMQRELGGNMAVTVGYVGATGRDLGFGGSAPIGININQIDPEVARRVFPGPNGTWNPAALNAEVPNPFFGIAGTGEFGARATIQAGQLLRPFPQFGDVFEFERTAGGKRQFHAATVVLDKRLVGRWGGRLSYTWSSTKDNQFGQDNTYLTRTDIPQNNYDLDAEYGVSYFDSPHRIILAPIFRFPDGGNILTQGWNASAVVELVSGAPLNAVVSDGASTANLGLFGGRQRPNLVGDPNTSGSDNDRVASRSGRPLATSTPARSRVPGQARSAMRRVPSATRAISSGRTSTSSSRKTRGSRQPHRADALRDSQSDQHGEVPGNRFERDHRSELRAYHAAGRVHADLAVELPVPVLAARRLSRKISASAAPFGRARSAQTPSFRVGVPSHGESRPSEHGRGPTLRARSNGNGGPRANAAPLARRR